MLSTRMLSTKIIKRFLIVCAAVGLIGMTAAQTPAQYSQMALPSWYDSGVMRQQTLNGWTLRDKARRTTNTGRTTANRSSTFKSPTATNQPSSSGGTTFRPVAASIAPQKLAAKASTPELRQKMQEFFADGLSNYEDLLRKQGLPTKDVVRATSFFIASAYQVASGNKLERSQVEAVRDDVRNALLDNEAFQKMSDREKQETYETMAIMGDFVMTGHTIGKQQNSEKIQKAFREMAKDQLERLLDTKINNIKITDNGIEF